MPLAAMYVGLFSLFYESQTIDRIFVAVVRVYFVLLVFSLSQVLYSLWASGNPTNCGGVIDGDASI
ncbi:MAG: hypothetical protein PHI65_03825 [Firmicutes bacterium]|nr:hypothetical protein [Bacillota bacterium]